MNPQQNRLLAWINSHDCGVTPTAIYCEADDAFEIRSTYITPQGDEMISIDRARTYADARAILGY